LYAGLISTVVAEETEEATPDAFAVALEAAKSALYAGNLDEAKAQIKTAKDEMTKVERILDISEISEVWYYQGAVEFKSGEDALDSWRQTLIVNLGQPWDVKAVEDESAQDVYLALKKEVQNRKIVSLQVPEQYGQAKLYVDGFMRAPSDFAYQGMHFAQIECPEGDVYSKWSTFEKTFKWIKMCPYKFDVTDMPEPEAADEWDMFGAFGGGTTSAPDVNMNNAMVAPPLWERIDKRTLYGSIGSATIAAGLYGVALSKGNTFDDPDNGLDAEGLESLRSQTNSIAMGSMTFGIVGAGLYMYSMSTAKVSN
jgi:hypothetical protein